MDMLKLKKRLRALKDKYDKASGCTEEEAMAAMEAAVRLSEKYGVSLDDLDDETVISEYAYQSREGKTYRHEVDAMLSRTLGKLTGTITLNMGGSDRVTYGTDADIELAMFIRKTLIGSLEREWNIYKTWVHQGPMKGARGSFARAYCERVRERMNAMIGHVRVAETHNALVVRKEGLIDTHLKAKFGYGLDQMGSVGFGGSSYNAQAAAAGRAAGNAVNMGRGVSQGVAGLIGNR